METAIPTTDRAAEARLRKALDISGHRFTDQRFAVYRSLIATRTHPTADEVFTNVREEISDISLATVYKALETLVSCGLAAKLSYGDGSARYDVRTDEHYHARCLSCGAVRDIEKATLSIPLPEPTAGPGFRVEGYRLEVVGYCDHCSAS